VVIGVVHGLAGSAAVTLLVLATIPSPLWGVLYLLPRERETLPLVPTIEPKGSPTASPASRTGGARRLNEVQPGEAVGREPSRRDVPRVHAFDGATFVP